MIVVLTFGMETMICGVLSSRYETDKRMALTDVLG